MMSSLLYRIHHDRGAGGWWGERVKEDMIVYWYTGHTGYLAPYDFLCHNHSTGPTSCSPLSVFLFLPLQGIRPALVLINIHHHVMIVVGLHGMSTPLMNCYFKQSGCLWARQVLALS